MDKDCNAVKNVISEFSIRNKKRYKINEKEVRDGKEGELFWPAAWKVLGESNSEMRHERERCISH